MIYNETRDNYTVAGNTFIEDTSLSAKAKGILIYLLHLPKDWTFYQFELAKHFSDGEKSLKSGFSELEKKGYIHREQQRNKTGRFLAYDWSVSDKPKFSTYYSEPKPEPRKRLADKRDADKRQAENGTLLITKDTNYLSKPNTNKTNNNISNEFETFWKLYPKKVAKKNAFTAFKTARKKVSLETIINGLKIYCVNIKTKQTEEKYIKYPQGWLNGERWTDGFDPEAKEQFEAQQRHARMIAEMEEAEREERGN